jgi:hypothetical protein
MIKIYRRMSLRWLLLIMLALLLTAVGLTITLKRNSAVHSDTPSGNNGSINMTNANNSPAIIEDSVNVTHNKDELNTSTPVPPDDDEIDPDESSQTTIHEEENSQYLDTDDSWSLSE